MNLNPRAWWAWAQRWYATHSTRDRRILTGVGVAGLLSLLYVGVVDPLLAYRKAVAEETTEGLEELERSVRFLNAADSLRAERDQLQKRLDEAKSRLLPGDSGTLGAAALQERANAIASAKGITVQSTQVMREEAADPFRKVSVRLTVSGELKPFADFISSLEYGPQQLNLPFVEISRRGAVAGQKGPRTLSATVEVSGYLRGAPEKEAKPDEAAPAEGETPPAEGEGEGEAGAKAAGEGEAAAKPAAEGEGAAKPAEGEAAGKPAAEGAAAAKPAAEGAPPPGTPPPGAPPPAAPPVPPVPGAAPPSVPPLVPLPVAPGQPAPPPAPQANAPAAPPVPPPPPPAAAPPSAAPPPAASPPPPPPAPGAPVIPVPSKGFN